jgi:hypothetical protein
MHYIMQELASKINRESYGESYGDTETIKRMIELFKNI